MDIFDFCMAYESDEGLTEKELIIGFQELIDSGLVWQLQGIYVREARDLINVGLCHLPKRKE